MIFLLAWEEGQPSIFLSRSMEMEIERIEEIFQKANTTLYWERQRGGSIDVSRSKLLEGSKVVAVRNVGEKKKKGAENWPQNLLTFFSFLIKSILSFVIVRVIFLIKGEEERSDLRSMHFAIFSSNLLYLIFSSFFRRSMLESLWIFAVITVSRERGGPSIWLIARNPEFETGGNSREANKWIEIKWSVTREKLAAIGSQLPQIGFSNSRTR